jgi:hypothetical protein
MRGLLSGVVVTEERGCGCCHGDECGAQQEWEAVAVVEERVDGDRS